MADATERLMLQQDHGWPLTLVCCTAQQLQDDRVHLAVTWKYLVTDVRAGGPYRRAEAALLAVVRRAALWCGRRSPESRVMSA
ncbi:hypothetical protein EVG20_g8839 [Dentipellis fragilis]|uniref:Uncharacterized protein n=1 Tax=Dentipellis fragilis TaxID=205917 RepID=A0A4Y9Y2H6_9AGAM|nr:hypothetical protein EVG20_g8839 [Dentipellis fragilis]